MEGAWKEFDTKNIDNNFLSLQACMESSIMDNGGNHYKQPHLSKERNRNRGKPVTFVRCSEVAFNLATNLVKEQRVVG